MKDEPFQPLGQVDSAIYCPRCGKPALIPVAANQFNCPHCRFEHYTGTKCAVASIVTDEHGHVLLLRRTRNPAQGKWTLPGGFIDPGETAEEAARREVVEETRLRAQELRYFFSHPNAYTYQGLTAPVCDFFFIATVPEVFSDDSSDEVEELRWFEEKDLPLDHIAFPSVKAALEEFLRLRRES
jgi:NADH pyrophosphatase NudC (nudix superfamily)